VFRTDATHSPWPGSPRRAQAWRPPVARDLDLLAAEEAATPTSGDRERVAAGS
jgi:hypothetical protein